MALEHGGDLFAVARARGWDWREVLDFSASINPLGPAPGVGPAICRALERIVHYPEREPVRLREALAEKWQIDPDRLILGNGATELIHFFAQMWREPVQLDLPVFSEFHRAFPNAGSHGLRVVTRPINPTGEMPELSGLQGPALIDESFLEFTGEPSAADRFFVLRSLTKFYALPGLRIGALIGPPGWRHARPPWQVNVLTEEAALAALADDDHAARSIAFVREERKWLCKQLNAPNEGHANYIYVPLEFPARLLCDHLLEYKILVRNCAGWPGLEREAVRVAVRTRAENERLVAAWRSFSCA